MHDDDDGFYVLPPPSTERPTLLNSCAHAATAAEAAFRVPYPNALRRDSRIIALDRGAAHQISAISEDPWQGAHFLILAPVQPALGANRVDLSDENGTPLDCSAELVGADVVVMVATTDEGAKAATVIGDMARSRGIMTAGIVLANAKDADEVMRSLRMSASVLVMASDADYLPAMLSALRA